MTVTTREALTVTPGCAPCQERADAAAADTGGVYAQGQPPAPGPIEPVVARTRWSGVLAVEGVLTGDGRMFEANALNWDLTHPLPLRVAFEEQPGHDGAVPVGLIHEIARGPGGVINASGDIDMGSPDGEETARLLSEGRMNWVSVDVDDYVVELRVARETLDEALDPGGPVEAEEVDDEGRVTVVTLDPSKEVEVLTTGRIRGATLVSISAFPEARIELDGEGQAVPLVASGIPVDPPAAWFEDPGLTEPTPLQVTPDGRVYGHLAEWSTCHTAFQEQGLCVNPPRSASGYQYFHTGSLVTREGTQLPVGKITMDTRHAGLTLSADAAMAHYEDTGLVVADVRVGEDRHGVWVAGALRPHVTARQARALRAAPLSGDWRPRGGHPELVAALGVVSPGFPIPRPAGMVAAGRTVALVASGVVPRDPAPPGAPPAVPAGTPTAAGLVNRVRASQLAVRVHNGRK